MYKQAIIVSLFILLMLFSFNLGLIAQYEKVNTQELKTSALNDFTSGNYSQALEKYNALISRYPKDGFFNYYSGICHYKMNISIPDAIRALKFATSQPGVPSDVWYYLGESYMKDYQFSEAGKAFARFNDVASKAELREKIPSRKSEMAANATELSKSFNSVGIIASSLFSFSDTGYIRQIRAAGGILDTKPVQLISKLESEGELSGFCFIPRNLAKGDYLYYSGYGRTRKSGLDIYRVKILGDKKFSEPELIKSLNTNFNEIIPYYDPIGDDLYFASEGHSSMGGYDIFKSHYKRENDSWSEPLNLGFPVNSPSNEYISIPGTDLGQVLLITDRQGLDTMLTVYILRIMEPRQSSVGFNSEELKRIGKFGGIESIPDIVNIADTGLPQVESAPVIKSLETRPYMRKDIQYSDEYHINVKKALDSQFRADSLAQLAKDARINVKAIADPDQRWAIQSRIISWEKQSSENQSRANEFYTVLKKLENGMSAEIKVPESIKKDTVINAITTYRFNTSGSGKTTDGKTDLAVSVVEPVPGRELNEPDKKEIAAAKKSEAGNSFVVLQKSPYSSSNPFPLDVDIPSGTFYRIQLGVFSQKQNFNAFGGLSPITAESIPGKSLTRYYAGRFTNYESVKSALNIVKNNGYKDAFIVAWYNGQKLTPDKVFEYEKRDLR